jgi:plasmid maintenance system antidote protein VapI
MPGAAQLTDWMQRRGFKQREAAEYLGKGFDETVVSALVNGRRFPGLENALTLERLTGIPAEAWVASFVDKAESAESGDGHNTQVGKA